MSDLHPPPAALPVPPPWPPAGPPRRGRLWPIFAFLLVALVVTFGVAIVGWFRPIPAKPPPPAPKYTAQQVAEAKTKVCAAYEKVHSAVGVSMARNLGSDPTSQLAVATSARQALLVGSEYLITTLSEEPATAPDLATAIRKLASLFQQYTVDYLNGRTNAEMESALRAGDDTTLTIESLCK